MSLSMFKKQNIFTEPIGITLHNLPYDILTCIREFLHYTDKQFLKRVCKQLYFFTEQRYSLEQRREEALTHHINTLQSYNYTVDSSAKEHNFDFRFLHCAKPSSKASSKASLKIRFRIDEESVQVLVAEESWKYMSTGKRIPFNKRIYLLKLTLYKLIYVQPSLLEQPFLLYFEIEDCYQHSRKSFGLESLNKNIRFNWTKTIHFIGGDYEKYIVDTLEGCEGNIHKMHLYMCKNFESSLYATPLSSTTKNEKESLLANLLEGIEDFRFSIDSGKKITIEGSIQKLHFKASNEDTWNNKFKLNFFRDCENLSYKENIPSRPDSPSTTIHNNIDIKMLRSILLPENLNVGLIVYVCILKAYLLSVDECSEHKKSSFEDALEKVNIFMFTKTVHFQYDSIGNQYCNFKLHTRTFSQFFRFYTIEYINTTVKQWRAMFETYEKIKFDHYPEDESTVQ